MSRMQSKLWLGVSSQRWLLLLLTLLVAATIALLVRRQLNLEWTLESIRALVSSLGVWAPICYITILTFRFAVLVPSSLLLLSSGILFGPCYGTAYAGLGLLGSGLWKYALIQVVGNQVVLNQLPARLSRWAAQFAAQPTSTWALAGICAYPFLPKHLFQFGAILSGMGFGSYTLALCIGSFARASTFAFLGESIYSGTQLTVVTLGFMAIMAIPLCISPWRRWILAPLQQPHSNNLK